MGGRSRAAIGVAELHRLGGYRGAVDLGVAVTGIAEAGSSQRTAQMYSPRKFRSPDYRRTERISAASELAQPTEVAGRLVKRLVEATAGEGFTPFA
jgi:hypothetical protein